MKPLFANVLVEEDKSENIDGLDVPTTNTNTGTVISVGEGTPTWPVMHCKVGDRIQWNKNAGETIKYCGKPLRILNEEKREIIAKL